MIEVLKQALEALEDTHYRIISAGLLDQDLLNRNFTVATALRERLAQPEQEALAIVYIKDGCLVGSHRDQNKPFPDGQYGLWPVTTPPQRTEQGDKHDTR